MTQTLTAPAAVTERASVKDTAAALRRHLRNAFPGTRFSVTMERGSAYGWIHVSWTDGPRWAEVRSITEQYESSRFDGRDDGYHATGKSRWNCCGATSPSALELTHNPTSWASFSSSVMRSRSSATRAEGTCGSATA